MTTNIDDATDLFLGITTLGAWRELTQELGWTDQQYIENTIRLIKTSLIDGPTGRPASARQAPRRSV